MRTSTVKHSRLRKNKSATRKLPEDIGDDLTSDTLRNAVERSTSANRSFFISFLIILLYLMIIVASTTDYQLLIPNSKIKLPFVDVDVSLILFYLLAPIIVLVGHFNMLQNLESHHYKLETWRAAYKGKSVPRALIEPFLYDHALLELDGQLTKAVRFFSRLLFLFLAPIVLLIFLWRFTDYQSLNITLWHLVLLLADMLIIAHFQRAIIGHWRISILGLLITLLALSETVLLGFILKPESTEIWQFEKKIADSLNWNQLVRNFGFRNINIEQKLASKNETSSDEKPKLNILDNLLRHALQPLSKTIFSVILPRISIDHTESLTLDDKPLRIQMAFDGETDFAKWFNKQKDNGWDLRKRNLKGAQLEGADLRHILLEKAQLRGAVLRGAHLQGANLDGADLQGANLDGADLQGANLDGADLQGASLEYAQLQGASLEYAQLQGASLFEVQLQGASLIHVQLAGASLAYSHLQGSNLSGAQLEGASLYRAQLQGASLESARFGYANLQGAILDGVKLKGALSKDFFDNELKVQSAWKIDMHSDDTDWSALKALNLNTAYNKNIDDAIMRLKANKQTTSPIIVDPHALSEALPELCQSSYFALQGSLNNVDQISFPEEILETDLHVWKELPNVPECKAYLEKIKQWGQEVYRHNPKKLKILIPEGWPKSKLAKSDENTREKPVVN